MLEGYCREDEEEAAVVAKKYRDRACDHWGVVRQAMSAAGRVAAVSRGLATPQADALVASVELAADRKWGEQLGAAVGLSRAAPQLSPLNDVMGLMEYLSPQSTPQIGGISDSNAQRSRAQWQPDPKSEAVFELIRWLDEHALSNEGYTSYLH